jgi:hypothetical protein
MNGSNLEALILILVHGTSLLGFRVEIKLNNNCDEYNETQQMILLRQVCLNCPIGS